MTFTIADILIGAPVDLVVIYVATKYIVIPRRDRRQRQIEDRRDHLARRLG